MSILFVKFGKFPMSLFECYSFLLTDSSFSSLWFLFREELIFPVMRSFGTYNPFLLVFIGASGNLLGHIGNIMSGKIIGHHMEKHLHAWQSRIRPLYAEIFIAFFNSTPLLGPVLTVYGGIIKLKTSHILFYVFINHLVCKTFQIIL